MKSDKFKIYILEVVFDFMLILMLFYDKLSKPLVCTAVSLFALFVYFVQGKNTVKINGKNIIVFMLIAGMMYLCGYYLLGLYFGFINNKQLLVSNIVTDYVIPVTLLITAGEYIRSVFIRSNTEIRIRSYKIDLSNLLVSIGLIVLDFLIYNGIYDLSSFSNFMTLVGYVGFASFANNMLFNYLSERFDVKGIIVYRLITVLYIFIIPVIPDVSTYLKSVLRIIYPYILYLFIEKVYPSKTDNVGYVSKKVSNVLNVIVIILTILVGMLISCKFRYRMLIIGTDSMTGTINAGDAVIYKEFKDESLSVNGVIVFDYNGIKTIHRITDARKVNGEIRYLTKGDANSKIDNGYRTSDDVEGIVKLRIKYIGYPTLWLRSMFD